MEALGLFFYLNDDTLAGATTRMRNVSSQLVPQEDFHHTLATHTKPAHPTTTTPFP